VKKTVQTLEQLIQAGIIAPSPDFDSQKQPDGRVKVSLVRSIGKPLRQELPGPDGFCKPYDDFWPSYFSDPASGNFWRTYCKYDLEFDFAQSSSTVSNVEPAGWFVPAGLAVPELLAIFTPVPTTENIHITLHLEMYRECRILRPHIPVSSDVEDSIPYVKVICWKKL
jgi:hypothetical protein